MAKAGEVCLPVPSKYLSKKSHFCFFYGQMNCHIHVHPLPSNLFIKKEKPVVSQFLLSRWLILISLQQAQFISSWNQSRWKCCHAVRFLFLKRWMGWRYLSGRTGFRWSFHQPYFGNALLNYGWSGWGIKIACHILTTLTHFQHKRPRPQHNDRLFLKVESADSVNNSGASSQLLAFFERYH